MWDFKETLGDLTAPRARVELAKDALALCNLPRGGTIVVGVTDKLFQRVGLKFGEKIDTTRIRDAVEKYIDGDFTVAAAEHDLIQDGDQTALRFGIVHFGRRSMQPVLAAQQGKHDGVKNPLFTPGDIFIRRGAASVKANSGDIRQFFASTLIHEEQMKAVNELWSCIVEQRRSLGGLEMVYDTLADSEYGEVVARGDLRNMIASQSMVEFASWVDGLTYRVKVVRPHLSDQLYELYKGYVAFVGRLQMKAIQQLDRDTLKHWTEDNDGSPDQYLYGLALRVLSQAELAVLWLGESSTKGTFRPLRPVIDAAEQELVVTIRRVLSGLT